MRRRKGFSVRTKVHEYGGGSFWESGEAIFFSNFADQRLYRQDDAGAAPVPITPEAGGRIRYADGRTVRERSWPCAFASVTRPTVLEQARRAPALDGSAEPWVVASGHDYAASPAERRWAAAGVDLLGITAHALGRAELWVAEVDRDLRPADARRVAGGPSESTQQPVWSPRTSSSSCRIAAAGGTSYRDDPHAQCPSLRWRRSSAGRSGCSVSYFEAARRRPDRVRLRGGTESIGSRCSIPAPRAPRSRPALLLGAVGRSSPWRDIGSPSSRAVRRRRTRSSPSISPRVRSTCSSKARRVPSTPPTSPSPGIEFPTAGDRTAHAYVYATKNPRARGPSGERPPLIVIPARRATAASSAELDLETQFWTTRGFAVVDVNYGGSTGYGRRYRERTEASGASSMSSIASRRRGTSPRRRGRGRRSDGDSRRQRRRLHDAVRPRRHARSSLPAGAHGVADAESLARDTHKFESRYLDGLIGPYPAEARLYRERSPIHSTHLAAPLIVFQGLEDEVVPLAGRGARRGARVRG